MTESQDSPSITSGGQGESILSDPHHYRADCKMLEMAIKRGWPITEKVRQRVVDALDKIVEEGEPVYQIAASRVLVTADGLNVRREADAQPSAVNNTQININLSDPAQVSKLGDDELFRLHQAALGLLGPSAGGRRADIGTGDVPA
jgi:hypothetical protein